METIVNNLDKTSNVQLVSICHLCGWRVDHFSLLRREKIQNFFLELSQLVPIGVNLDCFQSRQTDQQISRQADRQTKSRTDKQTKRLKKYRKKERKEKSERHMVSLITPEHKTSHQKNNSIKRIDCPNHAHLILTNCLFQFIDHKHFWSELYSVKYPWRSRNFFGSWCPVGNNNKCPRAYFG